MQITRVSALVLRLPQVTAACDGTQDTCLIRIDTDEGITGWGEVDSAPTVVKAIVDAPLSHQIANGLANALQGADPMAIDACWQHMERATNYYGQSAVGRHAMAGVDIALWDIAGQACQRPVHQLLGGPHRTRFRAYCSVLFGDTPAATYDLARRFADQGFTAIKFGWGPMGQDEVQDVDLVRQARRGAGPGVDILVDAGQVWDWKTALRRAQQFAEFGVFWLEEPLHPQDLQGYAHLCAASPVPIAAGEAESRPEEFEALLVQGGVDWIQPDPGRCGISTLVSTGRLAHRLHRRVVNHSFKSGITIAASLHGLAAVPHGEVFEYCMADSPLRHELTRERFEVRDGFVHVPDAPGLGITLNEETVRRYQVV
ncbi:MAG: mandelate racemase/muconate lactonizing enzyme family protein [Candidatus Latescibacterota bacterium]